MFSLQHLVRLRWDELSPAERANFANVAVELMSEMANACEEWALKSQTAALVAEVFWSNCCQLFKIFSLFFLQHLIIISNFSQIVRREGLELWQQLLPTLISLSSQGPVQVSPYFQFSVFFVSFFDDFTASDT